MRLCAISQPALEQYLDMVGSLKGHFDRKLPDNRLLLQQPGHHHMAPGDRIMSSIGGLMTADISSDGCGTWPRARSAAWQLDKMPGCESIMVPSRSRRIVGVGDGMAGACRVLLYWLQPLSTKHIRCICQELPQKLTPCEIKGSIYRKIRSKLARKAAIVNILG